MYKYRILVLGCGNIGAMYDINSNEFLTHVKSFASDPTFDVTIYDSDNLLLKKVSEKYGLKFFTSIENVQFSNFDCICICTPTITHFGYLIKCLEQNVKLIICEKPISYSYDELNLITSLYQHSSSLVLVNYIRRFQPKFISLKNEIKNILKSDTLIQVNIKYQKGFINNASHAIDLIQFLFDFEVSFENHLTSNVLKDFFEEDPTISMIFNNNDIIFNLQGFSGLKYNVFEIELYFKRHKIYISNSGNCIQIFSNSVKEKFTIPLNLIIKHEDFNCLKDYMIPVKNLACDILKGNYDKDNFISSMKLNIKMLEFLINIK